MLPEKPKYKPVVITSIREETPGVKSFVVASEDGADINYKAGQHITFVFNRHGREERRSYSISSVPESGGTLAFTVKRLDNGAYSRLLIDKAVVGDRLYTSGIGGLFTLPNDADGYEQVFFFAAGIGITPIISMIKTLLPERPDVKVVLVYSNRSKEEVVFYGELNNLVNQYPDTFKIVYLFSSAFDLGRARLSKALLADILKEYGLVRKERMLFYICGPYAYMRMAILALKEYGIDDEQIKKENFNTNDRVVIRSEPPDKSEHTITLDSGGKLISFQAQYPDSILQAAKRQGIQLPYSCETGRCGSCAALCTMGKVWMSYNEVLMQTDIDKGMILTCVSYAVDGDVKIEV